MKYLALAVEIFLSVLLAASCSSSSRLAKQYENTEINKCALGVYVDADGFSACSLSFFNAKKKIEGERLASIRAVVVKSLLEDLKSRMKFESIKLVNTLDGYKNSGTRKGKSSEDLIIPDSGTPLKTEPQDIRFLLIVPKCLFTGKVEKHNDIGMPVVNSSPNLIPSAENANKVLCVNQKIFYLLWDVLEKRAVKYGNCDSKNCTPLNRTENTHDYWGASTFDFVDKEFKDTPFIVKTLNASRFK